MGVRFTNFCGEGWVYVNPDAGLEYAPDHPKRSGEVPNAEHVRRSTEMEDALWRELNRLQTQPK